MKRILPLLVIIAVLMSTVSVFADDYDSMMSKAQSYIEAGDTERALASYQLAERAQPERPDAYLGEADLLLELENNAQALEIVNTVLEKDPLLPEAWVLKCRIDIAGGDAEALESDLLYAEVCGAELHDLYPEIARFYFDTGDDSKAVDILESIDMSVLPDDLKEMYQQALTKAGQETAAEKPDAVTVTHSGAALDRAFDENRLVLKKADLSSEILNYEIDTSIWETQGTSVPEKPADAFLKQIKDGTINLYSLSPSGNSGIFCAGTDIGLSVFEGKIHVIRPSETRGVPDINGNMEMYAHKTRFQSLFGKEGVVYSHNGQYAALYNIEHSLNLARYYFDPILIDLSTGEMFLTATYGNKPLQEKGGVVTTACFSADDQYFYYVLYGSTTKDKCALYRYDMKSMTTELCCSIPYLTWYPRLCEYAEGSFILPEDYDSHNYFSKPSVVQLTQTNGQWTVERHEYSMTGTTWYPTQLVYSRHSDYAFMVGKFAGTWDMAFMAFKPGEDFSGFNKYHAISKESQTVVDVNEETLQSYIQEGTATDFSAVPYEAIFEYELSPDGNYALILTKDISRNDHLYMLRLATFELKEVKGIDPSTIEVAAFAKKYQPIIEWNTETLIIITREGIETYEFDY